MARAKQDRAKTTQTSPMAINCHFCSWHHLWLSFCCWTAVLWAPVTTPPGSELYSGAIKNLSLTLPFASVPQESHRVIWLVTLRSHKTWGGKEYLTNPFSLLYGAVALPLILLWISTHRIMDPGHPESRILTRSCSGRENSYALKAEMTGSADSCS